MPTAGIVAEYNPFHRGHLYQLRETKKQFDRVIAVMSGHAVQRGGPAAFPKWARAEAAEHGDAPREAARGAEGGGGRGTARHDVAERAEDGGPHAADAGGGK